MFVPRLSTLVAAVAIAAVLGLAWWGERKTRIAAQEEIKTFEKVREADNRAFKRIMAERDAIQQRYELVTRELSEITDEPSVNYLDTAVPDSVRRLLER